MDSSFQPDPHELAGGMRLDRPRIAVKDWRIVPVAVIQGGDSPVAHFDGDFHITLIDMLNGVGYVIPYERAHLTQLRDSLTTLLEEDEDGKD